MSFATRRRALINAVSSNVIDKGICGANAGYVFTKDGTLTIRGTGETYDYNTTTTRPWDTYKTDILSIVIDYGITGFGKKLFAGCTNVTSVIIADTVTWFEIEVFYACSNLVNIQLSSNLRTIGARAFSGCSSMKLSALPSSLINIGINAFQNCRAMTLTAIPPLMTNIQADTFAGCTNCAFTTLPSGVVSLGQSCFNSTKSTISRIPETVRTVENYIFYGCSLITELTFEGTPTSISASAFRQCNNLANIYVPWSEGTVANAPWGATNATIHYDTV